MMIRLMCSCMGKVALFVAFSAAFFSCTQKPLVAPSGGAVQGGISKAQAQQSTVSQAAHEVQTTNDRVDAKDAFLNGYYKWKSNHPSPSPTP